MARRIGSGLLRWGNHYSLGIREIDHEHEALIELLNRLDIAFHEGQNAGILRAALRQVVSATEAHFRNEERLMTEFDYPEAASHKNEHDFLVAHASEFQSSFEAGQAELTESMMSYLKDWLRNHLLVADKRLGRFLEPAMRAK